MNVNQPSGSYGNVINIPRSLSDHDFHCGNSEAPLQAVSGTGYTSRRSNSKLNSPFSSRENHTDIVFLLLVDKVFRTSYVGSSMG